MHTDNGTESGDAMRELTRRLVAVPPGELRAKEAEYQALSKKEKREYNKRIKQPRKD